MHRANRPPLMKHIRVEAEGSIIEPLRLLRPRAFEATEAPNAFYRPGTPSSAVHLDGSGEF
jgi:hypothetical protein